MNFYSFYCNDKMYLLKLFVLITIFVWLATATEIFFVLPDNSSHTSCSSQPCATLSQYLLDNNGTLPVVSNVEYHFLPGEHYLPTNLMLQNLTNFTLIGATINGSLLTVLVSNCESQYLVTIFDSHEIKITNVFFKQCNLSNNVTYLLLFHCTCLKLENIIFLECGFRVYNTYGNFSVSNVQLKIDQQYCYMMTGFGKVHKPITQWRLLIVQ